MRLIFYTFQALKGKGLFIINILAAANKLLSFFIIVVVSYY